MAGIAAAVTIILFAGAIAPAKLRAQGTSDTTQAAGLQGNQAQALQSILSRIRSSGLSPDEIRSRLQSAGYNSALLDPYLGLAAGGTGSSAPTPGADVLAAINVLSTAAESQLNAATLPTGGLARDRIPRSPTMIDSLPVFGLSLFRNPTTQFEPSVSGPVDPQYRLGPQDVVAVILTGQVELAQTLEVTRDGYIFIPQVGQVFVANLTLGQATKVIVDRLQRSFKGAGTAPTSATHVYVSVARLRTNQVFVVGDVVAPGSYQVSSAATVLTALYAAGGPSLDGSMRDVELRRGGQVISTVDLYDYILKGDASHDAQIQSGDIIFVAARRRRVAVTGPVLRPAWFELRDGETLRDLIAYAGGLLPQASREKIQIDRILPPALRRPGGRDRTVIDVTGPELAAGAIPAIPLDDQDRVVLFDVSKRNRNRIAVTGNVWLPGVVAWDSTLTLGKALAQSGGVKSDTYWDQVTISRLTPDERRVLLHVRLDSVTGQPAPDVLIEQEDSVHVFSRAEFRPVRTVSIGGSVNNPGQVDWHEGLTLREALRDAGGLNDAALLTEVEVARMPTDRSAGQTATIVRVPIDSTYLFGRDANGVTHRPPGVPTRGSGAPEFLLQPYDQVNVLREPSWEATGSVEMGGEVRYPGTYAIRSNTERIADLIRRAGGLTERADINAAIFERKIDSTDRAQRSTVLDRVRRDRAYSLATERIQAAGTLSPTGAQLSSAALLQASTDEERSLSAALAAQNDSMERIGLDVRAAMANTANANNIVLQPGDRMYVPVYNPTVTVEGFVNAPVTLPYRAGEGLDYYIEHAGGATRNADVGKAFVYQPNGTVETTVRHLGLFKSVPQPEPGALVVVPPKEIEIGSNNSNWMLMFSAFASIATAAAAVISISK